MGKNEIFIHTNKGEYVGGETVYGTVYLSIVSPIASKSLKLKVKGYEKCEWEYTYSEQDSEGQLRSRVGKRKSKREFFKVTLPLIDYPGGFPQGQYSYPFQYSLPQNLPGVFKKEVKNRSSGSNWEATIKYKVKAEVDIPNTKHDLKVNQPLTIYGDLNTGVEPERYEKLGTVRTCLCIPRGDVHVVAHMDKNTYTAGETAQIHVEVRNDSAVDIDNFAVKLMRVVKLKGRDDDRDHSDTTTCLVDTVCVEKYAGCASGDSKSSDIPLPLKTKVEDLQPATNGQIVKCNYHIDIEMQVPWAPDIEIHAPIQLCAPHNLMWQQWQPPVWAGQCAPVNVVGQLAVPAQVLTSQTFTGMPGFTVQMQFTT
ncbi:arrestin domain-containing protein A-like [Sycon ciliatum]|uniref:arrestin domain-containing protein A-like n=1 Tax=Sycon ciliatum TaxID=27933 RepID=UPI0020AB26B5|eukprot:scpid83762/ scgid7758/ Arrestin domain-containing protein A